MSPCKQTFSYTFVLLLLPLTLSAYPWGPPDGYTNHPNESNCTACHSTFGLNSGQGALLIEGLPVRYTPDETYELEITLEDPDASRWRFEITIVDQDHRAAGSIIVTDQNSTQLSDSGQGRAQYLKHTQNGTFPNTREGHTWQFNWRAPAQDVGSVGFWVAGNAANNNDSNTGDRIYATSENRQAEDPPPPPDEVVVSLLPGWNLIGSPVRPDSLMLMDIFAELIENDIRIYMRDRAGRVFDPVDDVFDFESWNFEQAYEIKTSDDAEVLFSGEFVDPAWRFELLAGWTWVPFLREDSVHAQQAFAALEDNLIAIKDGRGRVMVPGLNINELGYIYPGEGWKVMSASVMPVVWSWPEPEGEFDIPDAPPAPRHFDGQMNTGRSMNVFVTAWDEIVLPPERDDFDPMPGDEVAVFNSEGLQCGVAVISSDTVSIPVWGDDDTTPEDVDGLGEDEEFFFMYWAAEEDTEFAVQVDYDSESMITWEQDALAEVTLLREVPNRAGSDALNLVQFALQGIYPNPFNSSAEVSFTLDRTARVMVGIWDLRGRLLGSVMDGELSAGQYRVHLDGSVYPAGVYLVGVESGGRRLIQKAALLK